MLMVSVNGVDVSSSWEPTVFIISEQMHVHPLKFSQHLEISIMNGASLTRIESGHQVAAKSPLLLPMS